MLILIFLVAYAAMVISVLKDVNNDQYWVENTPRNVRIKESLKEIGMITLGVAGFGGLGCLFIYMAFLL